MRIDSTLASRKMLRTNQWVHVPKCEFQKIGGPILGVLIRRLHYFGCILGALNF